MMGTNDINSGEDVLGLCITLQSYFHNNVSSWDGRTDFYGMMSETNHRTPNGYNFLHNPETDDMDIAYVHMGEIRVVFEDDEFDYIAQRAYSLTPLIYKKSSTFIDLYIEDETTDSCRFGVAINSNSMFVGTFELVGERCHFEGNRYDAHGMREYIDDYIPMEPFFFPDSELYQENL
jgi:hypothetical protein